MSPLIPLFPIILASVCTTQVQRPPIDDSTIVTRAQMTRGPDYSILIEFDLSADANRERIELTSPIVQLDVPESVRLNGPRRETHDHMRWSGFIEEPFEWLVEEGKVKVSFNLRKDVPPGTTIGLSFTAFVRIDDGANDYFLRRRLELPVRANSKSIPGDARDSAWGENAARWRIGDVVRPFSLPRADGSRFDASEHLGKRRIVLVTYRGYT